MKLLRDRCTGCGYCVLTCPYDAIGTDGWACVIDEACTDCNLCYHACPNDCFVPDAPLQIPQPRWADHYQAVVIGGGIGGLMAAAWLARAGWQVAVFEKLGFLGGRYTQLAHHGYLCSTGAWTPMGPRSHIGQFLADVGAEVRWVSLQDKGTGLLSRFRFADGREFDTILELMDRDQRRGFLRMLVEGRQGAPDDVSAWEFVRRYVDDPDVLAAVDATVATASGLHADAMPASEYLTITLDTRQVGLDFAFPVGGTRSLIRALASVIRAHGGSIFPRAGVQRIVIREGAAQGVILDNGCWVGADVVIHNAGVRRLLHLAGREAFPTSYLDRLEGLIPVDCAAISLGTTEPLWEGVPMLLTPGCRRIVGIFEPTFFDPGVAPPGRHLYDVFFPLDSADRQAELQLAMEDLRALFSRFDRVVDLCVPHFFTGAWTGAEVSQTFGQVGDARLDPRTPVENLYLVGMDVQGSGAAGDLIPVGVRKLLGYLGVSKAMLICQLRR